MSVAAHRHHLVALLALLALWLALACGFAPRTVQAATLRGSGHAASEVRTPGDFSRLSVADSVDVVVRQGPSRQVTVQADDNLLALLETAVQDGTLRIGWKAGQNVSTRAPVRVEVVTPQLSACASAGSGHLRLEAFETPALKVSLAGSGDVQLVKLSTEELHISIAGSGDVSGAGRAAKLSISVSGSGDVGLADMRSDEVSVRIAGSGDAAVQAHRTLKVSIAGSGDVRYTGEAQLTSSVAGSGTVRRR